MATALASQLAQLAAVSKATLNSKAQKAAHSKSLIWEPRIAAGQSYQTIYAACYPGFEELCLLDARFKRFHSTIFSEESQNQDRSQLTAAENNDLDSHIDAFLRLASGRLRLMPAIKSIEWLIRRFRIHEENTAMLLMAFIPYHSIPAFSTLLSILPARIPREFRFLDPYVRSLTLPPRSILVHEATKHPDFLYSVTEHVLESCRKQYHYSALIVFWGGLFTEAIGGIVDNTRSGRSSVQGQNNLLLLTRIGPIFAESLTMKKIPSMQIASYMALALFVSKARLEDVAVTAFMEQTVYGWSADTIKPGLVCLAILAQFRSAKQMSSKTTKALIKVSDIGRRLVEIGQERNVDKLANGLCLALIERLTKKGDARGLDTIISILSSRVLRDKQIAVIFKSLLLAALRLDDGSDRDGTLRRELGSALIALSQTSGKSGHVIQSVIQDVEFDIEQLEMKLDVSFRSKKLPAADTTSEDVALSEGTNRLDDTQSLEARLDNLSNTEKSLPSCLGSPSNSLFDELSQLFFSIVADQIRHAECIAKFDHCPKLLRPKAFEDCTYILFFVRIWCGPYPALARMAALEMVKNRLKTEDHKSTDLQVLIPYSVAALGDPSKRVRQAAAELVVMLSSLYTPPLVPTSMKVWGARTLYGDSQDNATLGVDVAARLLHLQILPIVEECIMDPHHIFTMLKTAIELGKYQVTAQPSLDKKDHMSRSGRLAVMSFFAHHAKLTPFVLVKERLLRALNEVRGVGKTMRTQVLLPVLQWWTNLTEGEAMEICRREKVDMKDLNSCFVDAVTHNDRTGLETLIKVLRDPSKRRERVGLMRTIFVKIRKMWPLMKDELQFMVAEHLLDMSQEPPATVDDSKSIVADEAAEVLRAVPLKTGILSLFLDTVQSGTKMITEPPPNKRRRTNSCEGNRGLTTQVTPELSRVLRRITFVLQLVEDSNPVSHPELLDGLFTVLSELQHLRTVVGSELGYLQNLILRCLLTMMPAYRSNKELKIDSSGGYGDLLVNCIQKSSSPVVQNAALLLVANLATTAPNLVLHSVMPIFTFMGTSVLRQNDDYSAHAVSQTIQEVIPPLIESLKRGQKNAVAGACDILVSFTTAYEHIPVHRRQGLFVALVKTLGSREFLFALINMLVNRYDTSDALIHFILDLLNNFNVEVQLETFDKILGLVLDLYAPKPSISHILLGISEDEGGKDASAIALRQLSALPSFLSNKTLKSQIGNLAGRNDMEASEVRALYTALMERILVVAERLKTDKALHERCGAALSKLLNLLSMSQFIEAVEELLDRKDIGLRHKVLRALEARVEAESNADEMSRKALLAFLPRLTAAIRESNDIWYKYTAVNCVDKIAEKYGKKDVEAVVAAATTIGGDRCLGHEDRRLRVMALLCLTCLVDVLRDAIVPVLPVAIPSVIGHLDQSLQGNSPDEELHSACYGFISSLTEHLPYMMSSWTGKVLEVSNKSAEAVLDQETKQSRIVCLGFLVKQLEAKELLTVLDKNWENALTAGLLAVSELIEMLGMSIGKHSKSNITKNATLLLKVLLNALDLRRRLNEASGFDEAAMLKLTKIEEAVYEAGLKMILKLNDGSFRPIFMQMMEWTTSGLAQQDEPGRVCRRYSVYGFLQVFFGQLKSIVTSYATYVVDDAASVLRMARVKTAEEKAVWSRVLKTLAICFEHDQDDFWQAPAHFGAIGPVLLEQFLLAGTVDVTGELIPAVVELAAAADSQAQRKEVNAQLMKHLKSEQAAVRLAAVRCEHALTDRVGEEWLSMLHEMLPRISELQEDDDEAVERETHRWIVKIEGVLGESLDSMLQ